MQLTVNYPIATIIPRDALYSGKSTSIRARTSTALLVACRCERQDFPERRGDLSTSIAHVLIFRGRRRRRRRCLPHSHDMAKKRGRKREGGGHAISSFSPPPPWNTGAARSTAARKSRGREEGSAMQCTLSHVARPATHKPAGRSLSGFFDGGTSFLYQWEGAMDAISERSFKESV